MTPEDHMAMPVSRNRSGNKRKALAVIKKKVTKAKRAKGKAQVRREIFTLAETAHPLLEENPAGIGIVGVVTAHLNLIQAVKKQISAQATRCGAPKKKAENTMRPTIFHPKAAAAFDSFADQQVRI